MIALRQACNKRLMITVFLFGVWRSQSRQLDGERRTAIAERWGNEKSEKSRKKVALNYNAASRVAQYATRMGQLKMREMKFRHHQKCKSWKYETWKCEKWKFGKSVILVYVSINGLYSCFEVQVKSLSIWFCVDCANRVHDEGGGCPIYRADITIVLTFIVHLSYWHLANCTELNCRTVDEFWW